MRRLVCAFVFFLQTPTTLATVFRHMFHSVGQDESAHMHHLAIASTAGLYKMINFIHKPRRSFNETSLNMVILQDR